MLLGEDISSQKSLEFFEIYFDLTLIIGSIRSKQDTIMRRPAVRPHLSMPIKRDILRFKFTHKALLQAPDLRLKLYKFLVKAGHEHLYLKHVDRWLLDYEWITNVKVNPAGPMGKKLLKELRSERKNLAKGVSGRASQSPREESMDVANVQQLPPQPRPSATPPPPVPEDNEDHSDHSETSENSGEEEIEVDLDQADSDVVLIEDVNVSPQFLERRGPPQLVNEAVSRPQLFANPGRTTPPWLTYSQPGFSRVLYPSARNSSNAGVQVTGQSGQMEFVTSNQERSQEIRDRPETAAGLRMLEALISPGNRSCFSTAPTGYGNEVEMLPIPAPRPTPMEQGPWRLAHDHLPQSEQENITPTFQSQLLQTASRPSLLTTTCNNALIPSPAPLSASTLAVQESHRHAFQDFQELLRNRPSLPNLMSPEDVIRAVTQMTGEGRSNQNNVPKNLPATITRNVPTPQLQPHFSQVPSSKIVQIRPETGPPKPVEINTCKDVVKMASPRPNSMSLSLQQVPEAQDGFLGTVGFTGGDISRIRSLVSNLTSLEKMVVDAKVSRMGRRNAFLTPFLTQVAQCYVDELKRVVHPVSKVDGTTTPVPSTGGCSWTASVRLANDSGTRRQIKMEHVGEQEVICLDDLAEVDITESD